MDDFFGRNTGNTDYNYKFFYQSKTIDTLNFPVCRIAKNIYVGRKKNHLRANVGFPVPRYNRRVGFFQSVNGRKDEYPTRKICSRKI